jgi:hypothetical protein
MIWVLVVVVLLAGFVWYAWKDQEPPVLDDAPRPADPPQMDHSGAPEKPLPLPLKIIKKIIPKRSHHKKKP